MIIASGANYRRLGVDNLAAFEGSSVHYWATPVEGRLCKDQEVAIVGAGNSAGQAAVYLASQSAKVWLILRGYSLHASMSRYLIERIAALPNVEVLAQTEVSALEGQGGVLEAIRWRYRPTGEETRRRIRHLFLFIGAEPNTAWLAESGVRLDDKGFVRTGAELGNGHAMLETNLPGVFAIGDVRAGSIKRVAAAVGEGAQVVATLHSYLAKAAEDADTQRRFRESLMADECTHTDQIRKVTPSALGCEECLKIHSRWVHLRLCRICGHVGCCDQSPHRHATQALPCHRSPHHRGLRSARGLGVVLCRQGRVRPGRRQHHAAQRPHPALRLNAEALPCSKGERGHVGDKQDNAQENEKERKRAAEDLRHRPVEAEAGQEQVHPDGRREIAEFQIDQENDREVQRRDPESLGDRNDQRHDDDDGRNAVEHGADDEEEDVQHEKEDERRIHELLDPFGRLHGHHGVDQIARQPHRHAENGKHAADQRDALGENGGRSRVGLTSR